MVLSGIEVAVIGWAVSPHATSLMNKLNQLAIGPFMRTLGIEEDVEKLQDNLEQIEAVFSAAERLKEPHPPLAKLLRKMKEAMYDADDVIDEYNYLMVAYDEKNWIQQATSSVNTATSRLFNKDEMQKRLSEAIKGMVKAQESAKTFISVASIPNNAAVAGQSSRPQQAYMAQDRVTTRRLHEKIIMGRHDDIGNIIGKIKEQVNCSSGPPLVISIAGVGGIGKTTLAQLVLHHKKIASNVFDEKMWVCVANLFDHNMVTRQVLAKVNHENITDASLDLDTVQEEITKSLGSKKFLLILDDVWVEDEKNESKNRDTWNKFFSTFDECKGGSSIVVTTRLPSVVNMIGDCFQVDLKGLSWEDSKSLFMKHAFHGGDSGHTRNKELVVIGEEIVKKLDGSPMALKFAGMDLSKNRSVEHWKEVHENIVSAEGDVLSVLKLSYDHLRPHLKPCFGYCSLFPKGYNFTEDEVQQLVHMWIAQGFINKEKGGDSLEVLGRQAFDDLCSNSFFETRIWEERTYVMHDIIHDLAQSVSEEECFQIQNDRSHIPEKTVLRHVSVPNTHLKTLEKIQKRDKLRTLLVLNPSNRQECVPVEDNEIALLASLTGARVLDLTECCIKDFPVLQEMIHLRYIAFERNLMFLPETSTRLFNLQVLSMTGHRLNPWVGMGHKCTKGIDSFVPKNLSSVPNLRHVYVLQKIPVEITGPCNIQQFHGNCVFNVSNSNNLRDIREIGFQGSLHVKNLENVQDIEDAYLAKMQDKTEMKELKLEWCSSSRVSNIDVDDVLKAIHFLISCSS